MEGSLHFSRSFTLSLCTYKFAAEAEEQTCLTLVDGLSHGDADPQTVGRLGAVRRRQVLAVGQLQSLQYDGVRAGDDVLCLAQIVLQNLALILAQVPGFVSAGAAIARREGKVAERRDGELGATI